MSAEHDAWKNMIQRCTKPNTVGFQEYGERGIKVCDRWLSSFENFLEDMGPRPSERHSIDRHPDNDGDYEPGNCRWGTQEEQANNRSTSVYITHQGETLTVAQWAARTGLPSYTIRNRRKAGMTGEKLFAPSVRKPRGDGAQCTEDTSRGRTPEYIAWTAMKQRCTNPKHPVWAEYGGAGVTVCERWLDSFDAFLADLGPRPSRGHSLCRRDKTLPYEPSNCYWATKLEQVGLSRAVRVIEHRGEVQHLAEWAQKTGLSVETIRSRLRAGWTTGQALGLERRPRRGLN